MLRQSLVLSKRPHYFEQSTRVAKAKVYYNINKTNNYYHGHVQGHHSLRAQKFPRKVKKFKISHFQKNPFKDQNVITKQLSKQFPDDSLDLHYLEQQKGLSVQAINKKWSKPHFFRSAHTAYSPAWSYVDPKESLDQFKNIDIESSVEKGIRSISDHVDQNEITGEDRPLTAKEEAYKEHYKNLIPKMTSYKYASREDKQDDQYARAMRLIEQGLQERQVPYVKADFAPKSPIHQAVFFTIKLRNLQDDLHELFAIRRYETLRTQEEEYQEKRNEIKILSILRAKQLAKVRLHRFDFYECIMSVLNIELIEPARRMLPITAHLKHKWSREGQRYGRAIQDKRLVKGPAIYNRVNTAHMNSEYLYWTNPLGRHAAKIIDMRVRTFAHLEKLEDEQSFVKTKSEIVQNNNKKKIILKMLEELEELPNDKKSELDTTKIEFFLKDQLIQANKQSKTDHNLKFGRGPLKDILTMSKPLQMKLQKDASNLSYKLGKNYPEIFDALELTERMENLELVKAEDESFDVSEW